MKNNYAMQAEQGWTAKPRSRLGEMFPTCMARACRRDAYQVSGTAVVSVTVSPAPAELPP